MQAGDAVGYRILCLLLGTSMLVQLLSARLGVVILKRLAELCGGLVCLMYCHACFNCSQSEAYA